MTKTISPFICLNDHEGFAAFGKGYHAAGGAALNVSTIRIGYPLASWYKTGTDTDFTLPLPASAVEELMLAVSNIITDAYNKKALGVPHAVEDFCIEKLSICDRLCVVTLGS